MTRAGWEASVLAYLREHDGYYTIWWATENQCRACALTRLKAAGTIREDHLELGLGYPHCHTVITERLVGGRELELANKVTDPGIGVVGK